MTAAEIRERTETLLKKSGSDEEALNLDGLSPQIAAFHGQQAIEKAFKAWLFALREDPPKIHGLRKLFGFLQLHGCTLPLTPIPYEDFNDYAVQWRYQDVPVGARLDLAEMRKTVRLIREHVVAEVKALLP